MAGRLLQKPIYIFGVRDGAKQGKKRLLTENRPKPIGVFSKRRIYHVRHQPYIIIVNELVMDGSGGAQYHGNQPFCLKLYSIIHRPILKICSTELICLHSNGTNFS